MLFLDRICHGFLLLCLLFALLLVSCCWWLVCDLSPGLLVLLLVRWVCSSAPHNPFNYVFGGALAPKCRSLIFLL